MNYSKVIGLFLATIAILAVGLIGFGGCAGNGEAIAVIPEFEEPEAPPIEVTIDQLYEEYMTDEAAANAKYKGKRLLFTNVEVEEINSISVDSANPPINYIVNHSVEFRPRYTKYTALVREGFVVDIVGEVRGVFGMEHYYLVVENCWINIVEGDIGTGADYEDPDY